MKSIINSFRQELELLKYSTQTIKYYLSVADQFVDYTHKKGNYTRQDVLGFLQATSHLNNSSKITYKNVLKRFFEFSECPWPLKKRELSVSAQPLPIDMTLTEDEVEKIFQVASKNKFAYAVVRTLAATGIRRMELSQLNRDNLHVPYLTILMLKGEGVRTLTLDKKTIKVIGEYLATRDDTDECLFLNPNTKARITPQSVTNLAKSLMLKVNIARKGLGAHGFRRALATILTENEAHPSAIQQYMGWKNPEMVSRYARVKPSWVEKKIIDKHYLFK